MTPTTKSSIAALYPHLNEIKHRLRSRGDGWVSTKDPMVAIAAHYDGILAPHHIFAIKTFCENQDIPYRQDESGFFVNFAALAIGLHLTCGFR
jgi:hypothetical protein